MGQIPPISSRDATAAPLRRRTLRTIPPRSAPEKCGTGPMEEIRHTRAPCAAPARRPLAMTAPRRDTLARLTPPPTPRRPRSLRACATPVRGRRWACLACGGRLALGGSRAWALGPFPLDRAPPTRSRSATATAHTLDLATQVSARRAGRGRALPGLLAERRSWRTCCAPAEFWARFLPFRQRNNCASRRCRWAVVTDVYLMDRTEAHRGGILRLPDRPVLRRPEFSPTALISPTPLAGEGGALPRAFGTTSLERRLLLRRRRWSTWGRITRCRPPFKITLRPLRRRPGGRQRLDHHSCRTSSGFFSVIFPVGPR